MGPPHSPREHGPSHPPSTSPPPAQSAGLFGCGSRAIPASVDRNGWRGLCPEQTAAGPCRLIGVDFPDRLLAGKLCFGQVPVFSSTPLRPRGLDATTDRSGNGAAEGAGVLKKLTGPATIATITEEGALPRF